MSRSWLVAVVALVLMPQARAADEAALGPARLWASGFAAAPRIPLAGDADGDGLADLLCLYPQGDGIIDLARTSRLGKPRFPLQARTRFGSDGIAAVCGSFTGGPSAEVLALFADGSVRLAHSIKPDGTGYQRDDLVARVPRRLMPRLPLHAVAGDFDADGRTDALLVGATGRLLLLHNTASGEGRPTFRPLFVPSRLRRLRRIAAGELEGRRGDSLVWLDGRGVARRASLRRTRSGGFRLLRGRRLLVADPADHLAVGRFTGAEADDVLVGRRLLPGGNPGRAIPQPSLPEPREARGDLAWIAADFTGDGRDDLLRVRRSGERFVGDDLLLHATLGPGSVSPLWAGDADNDGLPDAWETGEVKPGGLDLKALGCSPLHRDVIVEVQRFAAVPEARVREEMAKVVRYYRRLPILNPDGRHGIALHVIHREPIPDSEKGQSWQALGQRYHPESHRGITHWMVIYDGGGGQAGEMADRGSCGGNALYATFIHEFGHQLGLGHSGGWSPNWCPVYPSLMNYAYSYQLGGDAKAVGYSDGRLASCVLDERRLDERLPLPPDQVSFLAGPPYRYRIKPTPDGKGTLIDWNWNGVFGEQGIAADINYGYSTNGGLRHTIGKTYCAPALTAHGEGAAARLLLFVGRLPEGAQVPPADATAKTPGLCAEQPGRLRLRVWLGRDPATEGPKWSDELDVEPSGVIGDASAAYCGGATWVAFPTAAGVVLRRVDLDAGAQPRIGDASLVPNTQGCEATLVPFAGKLALLLWRGPESPVGLRLASLQQGAPAWEEERPLPFTSTVPVGAVEGAPEGGRPTLWVGLAQDQDKERPSRWQVRKLALPADGALEEVHREWIGGEKGAERGSTRILLLREPDPAFGPDGQLYVISTGLYGASAPWACHHIATRVADASVNGGWLTRRYYDEWTQSRSAPGACFFRGDIALASRWFGDVRGPTNDNLFVAFYGRGIESEPMGDFDDIGLIRDVGLSHSILYAGE